MAAVDFDGTIARHDRLDGSVEVVLRQLKDGGRVWRVLVTGRTVAALRRDLPDVFDLFDVVVAEDGAVLMTPSGKWMLADPVPDTLAARLGELGIGHHRGDVILAADLADQHAVLDVIRSLGLDCQLVANRAAVMVVPAGVTKGSGLGGALSQMGVSAHNAIGVGDAENDLSLLAACEVGVAVGDAVGSLRRAADVTLPAGGRPRWPTSCAPRSSTGPPSRSPPAGRSRSAPLPAAKR